MLFSIRHSFIRRRDALAEDVVRLLLDYDADPTLCHQDSGANALYVAVHEVNFKVVYCLLHHPKVKMGLKEGIPLRDYQITSETEEGLTALHELVHSLVAFYSYEFSWSVLKDIKLCLYAFLLSGIDVKEKLPTLISRLDLDHEACSRLNHLITEAEDFLEKAKGIDRFGPGFFERYVFSTKEEQHAFSQSARGLSYLVTFFHKKHHVVGKWPLEMSTQVLNKLLPPFGFFKSEFNSTSHNANVTSNVSRLSF